MTRHDLRCAAATLAAILWAAAPAGAVVKKLGYQGALRQSGVPLTGTHVLVFRVYGQVSGGAPLWTSASMNVTFTSGRFFALIDPASIDDWDSVTPFLELEVDGQVLAPREELGASAYALDAWQLSGKKYTSAASAPASPRAGDLWYDSTSGLLKFYNGAAWGTPTAPGYAQLAATQTFSGQNNFLNRVTVSTEIYLSDGFLTFAGGAVPPPAKGRVYFDPAGSGSFKVSLDGTSWVALSTGGTAGISIVTANAAQFSGDGSAGSPLNLNASSVTLQGNAFNAAGRLVRLDATGRYPALDGSQILNLPADTGKLSRTGDLMTGDLQVGGATASTLSASGYLALPPLGAAPTGAAGRVYFDAGAGKLKFHSGLGYVEVATGTPSVAGAALLASDQVFAGQNTFRSTLAVSTPSFATSGTPGVDSPLVSLRGQAWDTFGLASAQRQINLRTRVVNENAWRLSADRGAAELWSLDQSGNVASGSSVTASGFFGNGGGLTGVGDSAITGLSASKLTGAVPAASLGNAVLRAGDSMNGQLTLAASTLTVTGQDASGYSLRLSSGLTTPAGTVSAALFVGSGAGLTNVPASQVGAANVQAGALGPQVIASSIAVGAVQDPSIVSVSAAKLTGTAPAGVLANAVLKAGDAMAGPLTLTGSTLTVSGQDAAGYSLSLSSGLRAPQGTVNAGLFIGNGAGLTGVGAAQVPAGGVQAGALGGGVIASSVAVGAVLDASVVSVSASKLAGNVPSANLGNAILKAGDSVNGMLYLESAGGQLGTLTRPAVAVSTHLHTTGNLGVGNSDPGERLDVNGAVVLRQVSLPDFPPSGQSKLVMNAGKVKLSENGGAFVNLIGGAGGAVTLQSTTPGISDTGNLNLSGIGIFSNVLAGVTAPGARLEARGNSADSYTLRLGTGPSSYELVATTSGLLGLGTASPEATLDVFGKPGQDLARWRDPYGTTGYLVAGYSAADTATLGAYRSGWRALRISGSPVSFPDGRVGVGTNNPGARLDVTEPAALPGDTLLSVSSNAAAGSEVLVVKGDGKVGVGIAAPAHPLHVASYSLGRPSILIDNRSNATSISAALRFAKNGADKWAILTDASQANIQDLAFYDATAAAYRLYISSEGNVSIDGTTSPQAKLDVNGTVILRALPPTPPVAPVGHAKLWYDSGANKLRLSENGGAYTAVVGGVANAVTLQPTSPGAADEGHFNVRRHGIIQEGLEVSSASAVAADTLLKVSRAPLTGANELLVMKGDGLTGIGTPTPARRLHIAGSDGMRLEPTAPPGTPAVGDIVVDSGDSNKLKWHDGTAWRFAGGGWNDVGTVVQLQTPTDNVVVQSNLSVQGDAFSVGVSTLVTKEGRVGIGVADPQATLEVAGSAGVRFSGTGKKITFYDGPSLKGAMGYGADILSLERGAWTWDGTNWDWDGIHFNLLSNRVGIGLQAPTNGFVEIKPSATQNYTLWVGSQNETGVFVIDRTGAVGIGQPVPTARLQVTDTAATATSRLRIDSTQSNSVQNFADVHLRGNVDDGGANRALLQLEHTNPAGGTPTGYLIKALGDSSSIGSATDLDEIFGLRVDGQAFFNGGNVGIGTVNPKAADGSARTLQLGNNFVMQNVVGNQILVGHNAYYDGTWKRATADTAQAIRMDSGDIKFHLAPTGTADSAITNWDSTDRKMIIQATGNVGIGTMGPAARLDVAGGVKVANDASTCDATKAGLLRFTGSAFQVCKSNAWHEFSINSTQATVLTYTGADQTYVVPAGVTTIRVKLWGAGGGGGNQGGWQMGQHGGGGGFSMGTIAVTPGQSLTVIVGQGGHDGSLADTSASYGGGGRSCGGGDCQYSGQGGGRSAIRNGATELITAGGGGGGGTTNDASYNRHQGGAGGGYSGQDGECEYNQSYCAGKGGAQGGGGRGGTGVTRTGGAGAQFAGGYAGGTESYGGGGGGGWYGGGGGGYHSWMGGGGGGSGYVDGAGVSNAVTIAGDKQEPPAATDYHYVPGVGHGGGRKGNNVNTPTYGGNGLVVIIPN